jgi:hypothetical protein
MMAPPAPQAQQLASSGTLRERLAALGRAVGAREAEHAATLDEAWREARRIHGLVADALGALHTALAEQGSEHLRVTLGEPRLDEKHVRAIQFEVLRGRTVGLITLKSRGDVTLVGPFRSGKTEGPCESVPWTDAPALESALGDFLERFLEQAMTP